MRMDGGGFSALPSVGSSDPDQAVHSLFVHAENENAYRGVQRLQGRC